MNYLLQYRLRWGRRDTLAAVPSRLINDDEYYLPADAPPAGNPMPKDVPPYFTSEIRPEFISIIQNDWPYSGELLIIPMTEISFAKRSRHTVPTDVEHTLIWTRAPVFPPPHLVSPQIASSLSDSLLSRVTKRLEQDGICGFTGNTSPPPPPSLLPESLDALSDWGMSMDKLVISPRGTEEEERAIKAAASEVQKFVRKRWNESEWETAWFVNPPVSIRTGYSVVIWFN